MGTGKPESESHHGDPQSPETRANQDGRQAGWYLSRQITSTQKNAQTRKQENDKLFVVHSINLLMLCAGNLPRQKLKLKIAIPHFRQNIVCSLSKVEKIRDIEICLKVLEVER